MVVGDGVKSGPIGEHLICTTQNISSGEQKLMFTANHQKHQASA
jgi:hypothetical protein